jgi:[acyl-carrier-protein] S-malonyltransferase
MGREMYEKFKLVRDVYDQASSVLEYDIAEKCFKKPMIGASLVHRTDLDRTIYTQPAVMVTGYACFRIFEEMCSEVGVKLNINFLAGHSLGEYTALVCAGAIEFADAVRLVRLRAEAMQSAVPEGVGAMAAVLGLDDAVVRAVCAEAAQDEVLEAVNFNSPGQVVIAGHKNAVDRGCVLAKEKGAKRALPLPVSVPSHCALMKPAAEKLLVALGRIELRAPQVPVLHNADVVSYVDPDAIRDALARQLYRPVRWVETVQAMAAQGVDLIAECGPGKVLAGMTKRIDSELQGGAVFDPASLAEVTAALA